MLKAGKNNKKECLLDQECIKSHYKLIAADRIGQKGLNIESKAIQQMKILWLISK